MGGGGAIPPGSRGLAAVQALSPEARAAAAEMLERGGVTSSNVEALNAEAHPETLFGETTPSLQGETSAIASEPGVAKNVVSEALDARQAATPARLDQLLTGTFGERVNIAQKVRDLETAQANKSTPLYDAWSKTIVPPTPELTALMPRLQAAGVVASAQKRLGIKGLPAQQTMAPSAPGALGRMVPASKSVLSSADLGIGDPAMRQVSAPTARAYDFMKQGLDAQIQKALNQGGQAGLVHDLAELKGSLVSAIDNHPDARVAGVWKAGREAYAAPARIIDAQRMGTNFFNPKNSLDDMQIKMAAATDAEKDGFMTGFRDAASHTLRGSVRGDANLRNIVSSPEARDKIAWAVGAERADWFGKAIEHEAEFPKAKTAIIAGSQTAPRLAASKYWSPQPSSVNETIDKVMHGGGPAVYLAAHLAGLKPTIAAVMAAGAGTYNFMRNKAALAQFEKIRNEIAPVLTLKGADRLAAQRELLNGRKSGPTP